MAFVASASATATASVAASYSPLTATIGQVRETPVVATVASSTDHPVVDYDCREGSAAAQVLEPERHRGARPILLTNGQQQLADDVLLDELSTRFRGVVPIQPSPLLLAPDHTPCTLKGTFLNGYLIYCFVIGGECRLCFPQIISVVLQGYQIRQVHDLFGDLHIHMAVATPQQLETLKLAGVMPMTADSCGLVTKSDAERLVAKLLPQSSGPLMPDMPRLDPLPVCHDCFGGCTGTLLPHIETDEQIECDQCKLMFSGEKFVAHSHSSDEIRQVCHWGFDSSNWKYYLRVPETYENDVKVLQRLELYKYPPVRLGKRTASNAVKVLENVVCSKVPNFSTTAATAAIPAVTSLSEINEQLQKLRAIAEAAAAAAAAVTVAGANAVSQAEATVARAEAHGPSVLPVPSPFIATSTDYSNQLVPGSLINSQQLQTLLALQFVASQQLPLPEQLGTTASVPPPPDPFVFGSKLQPAVTPLISPVKENAVAAAGLLMGQQDTVDGETKANSASVVPIPGCAASSNGEGMSLEKLLEGTLKGPVLSIAQLLLTECRHEKELLLSQNIQLRRENALLRSALASSTVLTGLKELTTTAKGPL